MNSLDNLVEKLDNFLPKRELFLWSEVERDELKELREEVGGSGKKKAFGEGVRKCKKKQVKGGILRWQKKCGLEERWEKVEVIEEAMCGMVERVMGAKVHE